MHVPPDETTDAQPAAPENQDPPAQPKSAYQLPTKQNTVLRNMVWALSLTVAVVVIVGIAFFGVGSDLDREPLENSEVDVASSAQRAQAEAGFPVAAPALGQGWTERSARFTGGENARWQVQYSSPEGALMTLTEEAEVSAPMLSSALPGAVVEEELSIGGAGCQVLRGGEGDATERGIACQGEDFGILVHGDADPAELRTLTEAALADMEQGTAA
ncbi:DUF4245 family protein [Brachybacterium sp. GCM10030267]|uniref:DUF4245 family protein n=1 Tax=unclassified Brachybacterium TaxID=2623841 RepID=UPI0036232935